MEVVYGFCKIKIGSQGPLSGVKFHNIGEASKGTTEVTAEIAVKGIKATVEGTEANCGGISTGSAEAEYTTGNFLLTGETFSGFMGNFWYA